jgi:hypothetical protein
MASLRSWDVAHVCYDACNTLSQSYGCAPSPSWQELGGDGQNAMLRVVNTLYHTPADIPPLPLTNTQRQIVLSPFPKMRKADNSLADVCFQVIVALSKLLMDPSKVSS